MFFDTGAHKGFIKNVDTESLKLKPIKKAPVHVHVFGGETTVIESQVVRYGLKFQDSDDYDIITAKSVPKIMEEVTAIINEETMEFETVEPTLLLGMDKLSDYILPGPHEILENGFRKIPTKLGPVLCGPSGRNKIDTEAVLFNLLKPHLDPEIKSRKSISSEDATKLLWLLEGIGNAPEPPTPPWSGFSCLLYRVYALPTTDNRIFEIFHCIFEASLKFNLTYEDFTEKNNSFSHEFFLSPNKPFTYNNIKLNFGSPTKPDSTPSYFATDGKKFVMLSREDFDSSKHLKCPSKKDALNFNCTFMESIIRCNPAGNSENCHFDDQSIKEIFDNEKNQLPIETPFEVIYGDKEGVYYKPIRYNGIILYLQLKRMKIASTITKTSCQVEPLGLTGIRKTQVGVKFSYKCKASGKVAATISCEDNLSFEVICDETGKARTKQLPIVNQKNSLNCSTLCSGSTTFFTLDMKTVEEFEDYEVYPISTYEQARKHINKIWANLTKIDVYGVLLWFFDDAIRIMVLVMVIMVSFLIPLPYLLPYLGCYCECLKQCCLPRRVTKSSEKKEI
uniref:Phlebovirus glycoprotein G2 fusion domain-containing protein n=1 Tax=Acrobeloides nanus TaxID=290746 RepID=A0A914CUC1_9BILA